MKTRRSGQSGQVYSEFGKWYVRYRDDRVVNGEVKRARLRKELGPIEGISKKQARERAQEILSTVNKPTLNPETAVTLTGFVQSIYFPRIEQRARPSTLRGYRATWLQLSPYCERLWIREMRTKHAQDILDALAKTGRFNISSMRHLKSFLSGAFRLALQLDFYAGSNPVQQTSIPKVRGASDTHAYSLEEIEKMLAVLPEPASTAVVTAALTGARRGELRGMLWQNYRDGEMLIDGSIWESHQTDPKTPGSKCAIPIIPLLADRLESHRIRMGSPTSGPIFVNDLGKAAELNNLLNRTILPVLKDADIDCWHGWNGFRRGLATNLYRLGVPDKTIQAILRHANVRTTQTHYIKSVSEDSKLAMQKLQNSLLDRNWTGFPGVGARTAVVN